MENALIQKWLRRIGVGIALAMIAVLCLSYIAFAVPSSVTNLRTTSMTSSSVSLSWSVATSSNSTVIRYGTTGFPATALVGTSAYNGTLNYATVSGLTSGTTYYFAAWGYDGSNYSVASCQLAVTITSITSENATIPFTNPILPAGSYQDPDTSGWSWYPFNNIVDYFSDNASAHGGLGMPANNVMMFVIGIAVTGVGLLSYIKWRTFFASWFIVLVMTGLFASMHVMQWIVFIFLIVIGAGVWAVDRSTQ